MAQLRQTSNVPVILLTAKGEDTDKVLGLNVGADDYITKPFNPVEMLARVRSQLRRYLQLGGGQVRPSTLVIGGICLDDNAKAVTVDGDPVALTPKEYDILRFLMAECRDGVLPQRDLPPGVGRRAAERHRRYRRAHPASAGKAGDQPLGAPVHQGGLGQGL